MRKFVSMAAVLLIMIAMAVPSFADTDKIVKTVSGNDLVILDEADLLNDSEEKNLQEQMSGLCSYGDTIFRTMSENVMSAEGAADVTLKKYGNDGLVFLIDMENREIYMFTTYDNLTAGHCRSITDNVYSLASDGDYYRCASTAFEQAETVLEGQRIAQPMKYIDNAILAVIIAMIINFIWLASTSRKRRASSYEVAGSARSEIDLSNASLIQTGSRIIHHDSGGSGGGGGGGGGGGHGGGHSF